LEKIYYHVCFKFYNPANGLTEDTVSLYENEILTKEKLSLQLDAAFARQHMHKSDSYQQL